MKNKGRGFTLVELLAVIVILAVILIIAMPKISDVIKNSKEASLETTAKLIASQAEKKYTENQVLDGSGSIKCNDVAKISDADYESCNITFDSKGNVKVTIVGKGKFEGLSVINGTKDSATASEVKMPEYGKGTTYIKALYDSDILRTANGLKKDNTSDANIRYEGANPNNYVSFNDELWRIIGVFGDNIKLVRSEQLGKLSWDSSNSSINNGGGINEWNQADLKEYLNTMYYGGTSVTCYDGWNNKTTTCPTGSLNITAKSMINNYIWNTGAINIGDTTIVNIATFSLYTVPFYNAERGSVNGKICTSGTGCNDTVERTTTWQGYVALPYLTDWAYASSETVCETNMSDGYDVANYNYDNVTCKKNNWMHHDNINDGAMWMLSPYAVPSVAFRSRAASAVAFNYGISDADIAYLVFPTVYLNSNVEITSGSGSSSDPYILGV